MTGAQLGRPYRVFAPAGERIAARVAALDPELSGADRVGAMARIEGEEAGRGSRRAVAGSISRSRFRSPPRSSGRLVMLMSGVPWRTRIGRQSRTCWRS